MAKSNMMLTDEQWDCIRPFIPARQKSAKGGRPPSDDRACFEGILWVVRTGARWRDIPEHLPSASTCWRRLCDWTEAGVFIDMWHAFIDNLDRQGKIDWDEIFVDASFSPAKKGVTTWVKPNVERVQSGWWWRMAREYLWHVPSPARRLRNQRSSKKRLSV